MKDFFTTDAGHSRRERETGQTLITQVFYAAYNNPTAVDLGHGKTQNFASVSQEFVAMYAGGPQHATNVC